VRLFFNIIWIDDQPDNVIPIIERLKGIFADEGFILNYRLVQNIESTLLILDESVYSDNVDLILVDYDLGTFAKGDEGIVKIREKIKYKDIIFYSGNNPKQKIRDGLILEGIYFSDRQNLLLTVEDVFNSITKKYLDIDHLRGIVLGATSDLEFSVNHFIKRLHEISDDSKKQDIVKIIKNEIFKEKGVKYRFTNDFESIESSNDFNYIIENYNILTPMNRSIALRKIFKKLIPSEKKLIEELESYEKDILPKRNDLAHLRCEKGNGFSKKFFTSKNIEVNFDEMKALRKSIIQKQTSFEECKSKNGLT
jgi:hypothetical protein